MVSAGQPALGSVASLWRYPVKSMLGEELQSVAVTELGLAGDRAYGLVDLADGKVATAKNPRKWPGLFDFAAALVASPRPYAPWPAVRVTLPDGRVITSDQDDRDELLSAALQRKVVLQASQDAQGAREAKTTLANWATQ